MDNISIGALRIGAVITTFVAVQLARWVGVAVLLFKIWAKVKHLPQASGGTVHDEFFGQ